MSARVPHVRHAIPTLFAALGLVGCGDIPLESRVCIELYAPVCGVDGRTYDNECFAGGADRVAHQGPCKPEPPKPCAGPCDHVRCAPGTHCEVHEVQCVAPPCHPVVECVPDAPHPCALVLCAPGTHCAVQEVQCVAPPCDPVPVCVPDEPHPCAAILCPGGTHCEAEIIDECFVPPCIPRTYCVRDRP